MRIIGNKKYIYIIVYTRVLTSTTTNIPHVEQWWALSGL